MPVQPRSIVRCRNREWVLLPSDEQEILRLRPLTELNHLPDPPSPAGPGVVGDDATSRQGFSRRLRAIGHLFEAEDESQQWPELHNAIRHARKTYQADGTMPDWAELERLLKEVRQHS